ncbi:hypothetical protein [Xanthomonas albilineans]|uniref:hypothetical protein n=1 Tax=Xanthomonas albilineans TaxID=29447 RepID=UPI000AC38DF8|nr:hypothetical protein [Xanthomonas albilineans]
MAKINQGGRIALYSTIAGIVFGLCGTGAGIYFGLIRPAQQAHRTLEIPLQSVLLAVALLVGLVLACILLYASVRRSRKRGHTNDW